jgi:hypothetical protein
LEAVYTERSIPPTLYNVVKGEKYCGEIKVGLTFTPEVVSRNLPLCLYLYTIVQILESNFNFNAFCDVYCLHPFSFVCHFGSYYSLQYLKIDHSFLGVINKTEVICKYS